MTSPIPTDRAELRAERHTLANRVQCQMLGSMDRSDLYDNIARLAVIDAELYRQDLMAHAPSVSVCEVAA